MMDSPTLFDIEQRPGGALWLWSAMTLASDGEHAKVVARPTTGGAWRLSDDASVLMHASAVGESVSLNRAKQAARMMPVGTSLLDSGEIIIERVDEPGLLEAALRHITAQVVLSHAIQPQMHEVRQRFESRVEQVLRSRIPNERLKRRASIVGASGHQIEIPFVVDADSEHPILVAHLGTDKEGKYDWGQVYSLAGRFTDLMNAGYQADQRQIVIEDNAADVIFLGQAQTILAESANVLPFSRGPAWAEKLAA